MNTVRACLPLAGLLIVASAVFAAEPGTTTIGAQWFLDLHAGDATPASEFSVDRGYIIIKHQLNERLGGRITPDISVDREGDGQGDLEMRLKYCYVDWKLGDLGPLNAAHVEFGLVHRPWLDFEEHVQRYRVQGTMFLERNGLFNSGDYGTTFFARLGEPLPEEERRHMASKYAGRRGSVALGLYNGGGYHAIEANDQKTVEGRVSFRPLPDAAPGLQLSYHGVIGRDNTVASGDWTLNLWHLAWEHPRAVLTAQYYHGRGDFKGNAVDVAGDPLAQTGFSIFGELRLHERRWSLLMRYDTFDDVEDDLRERLIAGVAHHVDAHTKVVLDYDVQARGDWGDSRTEVVSLGVEFGY